MIRKTFFKISISHTVESTGGSGGSTLDFQAGGGSGFDS